MEFFLLLPSLPGRRPLSMSKKLSDNCYKEKVFLRLFLEVWASPTADEG